MSSPSPPRKGVEILRLLRCSKGTDEGAFERCISRPNSFHHPSFLECSRALELAVESFVNEAAKKKAEYDAHDRAGDDFGAREGTIGTKGRTRKKKLVGGEEDEEDGDDDER